MSKDPTYKEEVQSPSGLRPWAVIALGSILIAIAVSIVLWYLVVTAVGTKVEDAPFILKLLARLTDFLSTK